MEENEKWEEVAQSLGLKKKDALKLRAQYMQEFNSKGQDDNNSAQSGEDEDEDKSVSSATK